MTLRQIHFDQGSFGKRERLLGDENRFAGMVSPPRTDVDAPGGIVFAVDRETNGTGDPLFVRLVVENRIESFYGRIRVRGCRDELDPLSLVRLPHWRHLDLKFRQSRSSFDRSARA